MRHRPAHAPPRGFNLQDRRMPQRHQRHCYRSSRPTTFAAAMFMLALAMIVVTRAPAAMDSQTTQSGAAVVFRWSSQPLISRYRLQLARDEAFKDIVFDRAVVALEYKVTELPAGNYYWRVAPAARETGRFTKAAPVAFISGISNSVMTTIDSSSPVSFTALPASTEGWRATTGSILHPVAARLRPIAGFDLVGANSDGTVYALDGSSGAALWAARFRPQARPGDSAGNGGAQPFTPVVINEKTEDARVAATIIVAFEGGVRALNGATGRERWRATISGRAASAMAADLDGDGAPEIIVVDDISPSFLVLNATTGALIKQNKLEATVIGSPAVFASGNERGLLFAMGNGALEMRNGNGEKMRSVKLDASITTPPLITKAANGVMVAVVGTQGMLVALDATDLHQLWQVAIEADAPRGELAAADLDSDGAPEIVMVTERGRVVAASSASGKIIWARDDARDASSAAFADLNGDGALDVMVAAGPLFAVGYSGNDGALIWRGDEEKSSAGDSGRTLRTLVTAAVGGDGAAAIVVGTDSARNGLRAIGLPRGAVKAATR